MRKEAGTMSPMEAKSLDEVCRLQRDNYGFGDFWILTDGHEVTVAAQKTGESPTGEVSIPRAEFNRLIRWYIKRQRLTSEDA